MPNQIHDKLIELQGQTEEEGLRHFVKLEKLDRYTGPTPLDRAGFEFPGSKQILTISIQAKKKLIEQLSYQEYDSQQEVTTDEVIQALRDPTLDDATRTRFVIEFERLRIPQILRDELALILNRFIIANRGSTELEMLVAVGSAIRKYISLLDTQRLGELATLLESGHNSTLSLEMELEVIKMIGRKLEARPPVADDQEPELATQLARIASDYLRPSTISKDKFSTVAMLSIEALAAMRSTQLKELLPEVNACTYDWFRQQLKRHLTKIDEKLCQDSESCDWLTEFISEINIV